MAALNVINCKVLKADNIDSTKINMHGGIISNVGLPVNAGDVATKTYVDDNSSGSSGSWKTTADVCATSSDVIGSVYEDNSITWPMDKTQLDGVTLELDMRVLIVYVDGENDGSSLGIYVVSALNPTVLTRSSDAPNGANSVGTLVFVTGSFSGSESYVTFIVPSNEERTWGSPNMYFIKYYKYFTGESDDKVLVSKSGIPSLSEVQLYSGDEGTSMTFGGGDVRINMGNLTLIGGDSDAVIESDSYLTTVCERFEVNYPSDSTQFYVDPMNTIIKTACGISTEKSIITSYSVSNYSSSVPEQYTPQDLLGAIIYRSANSPSITDLTPTAVSLYEAASFSNGMFTNSGIKFTVINTGTNAFVLTGGAGVTDMCFNEIAPGSSATFVLLFNGSDSSAVLHNLSKYENN